jgi:hypothetical protein
VKKRIYTAPTAAIVHVITNEGIAAVSNLSASIIDKEAAWLPDESLGDAATEGGNVYMYWE